MTEGLKRPYIGRVKISAIGGENTDAGLDDLKTEGSIMTIMGIDDTPLAAFESIGDDLKPVDPAATPEVAEAEIKEPAPKEPPADESGEEDPPEKETAAKSKQTESEPAAEDAAPKKKDTK